MAYWDTSCLLKLYTPEPDSSLFKAHVLSGASVTTSEIARLELYAARSRQESAGSIQTGGARRALAMYDADLASGFIVVAPISAAVVARFESLIEQCYHRLPPLLVRTMDAIHLATAVTTGESEIVTTDNRMRDVAFNLGMVLYPPP